MQKHNVGLEGLNLSSWLLFGAARRLATLGDVAHCCCRSPLPSFFWPSFYKMIERGNSGIQNLLSQMTVCEVGWEDMALLWRSRAFDMPSLHAIWTLIFLLHSKTFVSLLSCFLFFCLDVPCFSCYLLEGLFFRLGPCPLLCVHPVFVLLHYFVSQDTPGKRPSIWFTSFKSKRSQVSPEIFLLHSASFFISICGN